jgi:flagellar motor component MotA
VQIFSVLTLVFGPSLAFTMTDGPPNAFGLKSPWSIFIVVGASIGITALLVVFLVLTPTVKRLTNAIMKMKQNPQQPPPAELQKLQKRLAIIPPLAVSLLLSTEVFMVAAAQF